MRTIVVTGGGGFIGSAVVRQLIGDGATRVVNVDKMTYAAQPESLADIAADANYQLEQLDICDAAAMQRVFQEHRPDAVLHLAAETHVDRSIDGPDPFVMTNVLGTVRLLSAALTHWKALDTPQRDRFRFVHVSTDEVFGSLGPDGRFTEASPYDPRSPYSASKAASDHFARAFGETYGLPVIITNTSNNFGPRQFPEKLIPLICVKAMNGEPLPVYGRGENVRDWIHVDDHARGLCLVLQRGRAGETYLIGAGNERSNIDIVRAICRHLDLRRPAGAPHERLITFVADRPGHDLRYAIDASKISRELGWQPQYDFACGLADTIDWYLENVSWWQPILATRYAGERIGLGQTGPLARPIPG